MDEIQATAVDETAVEQTAAPGAAATDGELLALAREALIAAHPDAVPELIVGQTAAELRASVAAAQAAYARIAAAVRSDLTAQAAPVGAIVRSAPENAAALSPSAKIAAGLRRK